MHGAGTRATGMEVLASVLADLDYVVEWQLPPRFEGPGPW